MTNITVRGKTAQYMLLVLTALCLQAPMIFPTLDAGAQIIAPEGFVPEGGTAGAIPPAVPLLEYRVGSLAGMDAWPVDSVRSGEKLWAETTWGGDDAYTNSHVLFKRLYNYNIWPNRVVFRVDGDTGVVRGEAYWRRSQRSIRVRGLKLVSAVSGEEISDARLVHYDREKVVVDFRPVDGPGIYHLYFCALEEQLFAPSDAWLKLADAVRKPVPAYSERIEARCELDSFHPMETIPLKAEYGALLDNFSGAPYLVFPVDRDRPIKLDHDIPASFALRNPHDEFRLEADKNEYRVFQIGIWGCRDRISDFGVTFGDFRSDSGSAVLPSSLFQCLTLTSKVKNHDILKPEGPFPVEKGQVFSLWCGIDLPENVAPGVYRGTVRIVPANQPPASVPVVLAVSDKVVEERGDHDLHRLSRLRWMESDTGVEARVFPPFRPLAVSRDDRSVSTWGHTFVMNEWGLPASVVFDGDDILSSPMEIEAVIGGRTLDWKTPEFGFTEISDTLVRWEGTAHSEGLTLIVEGSVEFEGTVHLSVRCESGRERSVDELSFSAAWRKEYADLISGLGFRGKRDRRFIAGFGRTSLWLGSTKAGLGLFGNDILIGDATPFDASSLRESEDAVVFRLEVGPRRIAPGTATELRFTLIPTPVKPPDPRHWDFRYLHMSGHTVPAADNTAHSYLADGCKRLDELVELGVTRLNLHDWWGPSFNYPWQWDRPDNLTMLTREAHKRGLRLKVYNSGRELSNTSPEFWPLLYEGTGYAWREEIDPVPYTRFRDAWTVAHLPDGIPEGWPRVHEMGNEHSVPIDMGSRIGNFYIEGIRYMIRFYDIDGVYSDGAVTRKDIARRLRNIFNELKPDATVDVHGSALSYLHVLPYIDSVWNGEGVRYDVLDPWSWRVEVSGLPFGIPSEMLTGDQYMDRGMLFGVWPRMGWGSGTERQHRLWEFFDRFGIERADMRGWWETCNGVHTDSQYARATAFVHPDNGIVLAVANWHPPYPKWMEQVLGISIGLDRDELGLPGGKLRCTDVITGEELDITKPVPFREPEEHILSVFPEYFSFNKPFFEGRIMWIRGGE